MPRRYRFILFVTWQILKNRFIEIKEEKRILNIQNIGEGLRLVREFFKFTQQRMAEVIEVRGKNWPVLSRNPPEGRPSKYALKGTAKAVPLFLTLQALLFQGYGRMVEG
jgi:hypothetical protein